MSEEESSLRRRLAALVREAKEDLDDSAVLAMDIISASGLTVEGEIETEGTRSGQSLPGINPQALPLTSSFPEQDETLTVESRHEQEAEELLRRHPSELHTRYDIMELLGEGGMGQVHLAHDRNLGREVALKSIPPHRVRPHRLSRFVTEARITAQLEHPGIVPVHDLFISVEGDVFYTMKRVQGRTLREVIDALRSQEPGALSRYTPAALIGIFRSACQAVAYAHQRGIIHRDLKPENIMIGDFGEVLLMDWGVARSLSSPEEALTGSAETEGVVLHTTADGAVVGSPAYMSPEAIQGKLECVDCRSDVFSLGVILYELLTLQRPFSAKHLARLLYLVVRGEFIPPSQKAPDREIAAEIEGVCLKALATDPDHRFQDASALVQQLTLWLEGVGPREEADRLAAEGEELLLRYEARAEEAEEALLRATTLQAELKPWDPLHLKRLAWQAGRDHADRVASADRVFGDCEAAFESAISQVPTHSSSRTGLAKLYWLRFLEAEDARDARGMRRWEDLIRRYAPDAYATRLLGTGSLLLRLEPATADVLIHRQTDIDGRLVSDEGVPFVADEDGRLTLPMGPYSLTISSPGFAAIHLPILIHRLQNLEVVLNLPTADDIPEGFVVVPGSNGLVGGDPDALSGLPETVVHVPTFAIAKHPVSTKSYFEFLIDLHQDSPREALARAPRRRGALASGDAPLFDPGVDDLTKFPTFDREGREWLAQHPIVGIGAEDALAYTRWYARTTPGHDFRLPTEAEWEKAARGADRRIFPWGNRFDANFCVMAESSEQPPTIPRIGSSLTDKSPYGVHGMAGGVRDWCIWDDNAGSQEGYYPARGGSFSNVEIYCRCASRSVRRSDHVGFNIGFRLAISLPEEGPPQRQ
jgi:serine/threonine protein kinase/formylglycine-generating enzyme required for sulfatase activity